jgi:hypothetical protein
MNQIDLDKIEKSLNIKLPDHYISFQLNYPEELRNLKFDKEYLSENPDWLIEINQILNNIELPKHFFSIGHDLGGNLYFIKNDINDKNVYYRDLDEIGEDDSLTELLLIEHTSLEDYKNWLIEFLGEINLY